MSSSRTGTTAWLTIRKQALRVLPLTCAACGSQLDRKAPRHTPTSAELDHIVPHSRGGQDVIENVQWLCFPCNRSKSDGRSPVVAPKIKRVREW